MSLLDAVTAPRATVTGSLPSYAVPHNRSFDERLCLYGFSQSVYARALSKINSTRQGGTAKILCIGDSTTAGTGATGLTAWPIQLRALLALTGCKIRGTGIAYASQGITDSRWSSTGTVTGFGMFAQLSANASRTFVSDQSGDSVDIWYFNTTTAAFTYQIDGGAPVTVTPTGTSTAPKVTVTGLSNTTHTVKVTAGSGGTMFLIGINVYDLVGGGLQITNAGVASSKIGDWTSTSLVTDFTQATLETPDLILVALGINDSAAATNLTTFINSYTTFMTNAQAIAPVIPMIQYNSSSIAASAHYPYASAIYSVADNKSASVIDMFSRWGSYFNLNSWGLTADAIHLNAKGYADWAQMVSRVLQ